jgi:ketosteroid isomerase-like protein
MRSEPTTASALQLTRRSFEAANSCDYDAMMSFYGPDSVFDMAPWGLGTYVGTTAIRAFFEDWIGGFDEFEMRLEEVVDLGHEVVFAVACQDARPVGSHASLRLRHAAVTVWRDGVAMRVKNYRDLDEGRTVAEKLAQSMAQSSAQSMEQSSIRAR